MTMHTCEFSATSLIKYYWILYKWYLIFKVPDDLTNNLPKDILFKKFKYEYVNHQYILSVMCTRDDLIK